MTTRSRRRALLTLLLPYAVAACGGDKSATPSSSLAIAVSSGVIVAAGQSSAPVSLTLTRVNTSADVTLSAEGLPTGVTATFSPAVMTSGAGTATMTLIAATTTAPGSLNFVVKASGGGQSAQASVSLTVQLRPDFTIALDSAAYTVPINDLLLANLVLARNATFTGEVQLSAGTLPDGVLLQFAPTSVLAAGVTTARPSIGVAATTTPGTYPITITATAAGLTPKVLTFNLTVVRTGSISIRITPPIRAMVHNDGANYTVTVTRTPPFAGSVTLTRPTSSDAYTFGFTRTIIPANDSTAELAVGVYPPAGSATPIFTVGASGAGVLPVTATFAVAAIPIPATWLTIAALDTIRIAAGSSTTLNARIARNPAFAAAVSYAVTSPITGVTTTFSPSPATGTAVSIQIAVASSVAPGAYFVQWFETSGAESRGVGYWLRVLPVGTPVSLR